MHGGVATPRPPALGPRRDLFPANAEPLQRSADAEIRGRERVGVPEHSHPHICHSPWTDPRDPRQGRRRPLRVGRAVEHQVAQAPGRRSPDLASTSGRRTGSARSRASTAAGSASRSNSLRAPSTIGASSGRWSVRIRSSTPSVSGRSSSSAIPPAVRIVRRYLPSTTSSTPGVARAPRNASSSSPRSGGRARRCSTSPSTSAVRGARFRTTRDDPGASWGRPRSGPGPGTWSHGCVSSPRCRPATRSRR